MVCQPSSDKAFAAIGRQPDIAMGNRRKVLFRAFAPRIIQCSPGRNDPDVRRTVAPSGSRPHCEVQSGIVHRFVRRHAPRCCSSQSIRWEILRKQTLCNRRRLKTTTALRWQFVGKFRKFERGSRWIDRRACSPCPGQLSPSRVVGRDLARPRSWRPNSFSEAANSRARFVFAFRHTWFRLTNLGLTHERIRVAHLRTTHRQYCVLA